MFTPKNSSIIALIVLMVGLCVGGTLLLIWDYITVGTVAIISALLLFAVIIRFIGNVSKKVGVVFNAIENNDSTFRLREDARHLGSSKMLNASLNRIRMLVSDVRQEVRERERYFETILEEVSTGVIIINDIGVVILKNSQALTLLHVGHLTHIHQLASLSPSTPTEILALHSGESIEVEFFSESAPVRLKVTATDVTLQGKAYMLLTLSDILSSVDRAEVDSWARMTRVLTHEIMNSLAPITSLSQSLKDSHDAQMISKGLEVISSTSQRLYRFVDNYRRIARLPQPIKEPLNLFQMITEEIGLLGVDVVIKTELEDVVIMGDSGQISQIVVNMLKNAADACRNQLDAQIWVEIVHAKNGGVDVTFCNTGELISEEIRDDIFVPFFTTKQGGSGIGLSLCRQIVRLHGGKLSLQTRPYTRFTITL